MNPAGTTPAERGYEESYYRRPYFGDHPGKRRSAAEVIRQLRIAGLEAGKVLDVGSGAGFLLRSLSEQGFEVAGMDLSPDALRLAESNVQADLRLGDVSEAVPFADAEFDGVLLHDVIEHLQRPDGALAEIRRVLRPGGLFLVSTLNEKSVLHTLLGKRWSYYQDPTHVCMYGLESLEQALREGGFEIVRHWTYFDLNKAGETTAWMRPLRSLARVVYVPRRGESMTVVGRKPGGAEASKE